MSKTWEQRNSERESSGRTYYDVEKFLEDFRANSLKEHFLLDEGVFMELCSAVQADPDLAKDIADRGVLLIMKSQDADETDGLVALALQIAEENDG